MALTDQEIAQFATFAVEQAAVPTYNATEARKGALLKECRLNALAFYEQAQSDVRSSGYRLTPRTKTILWKTLTAIRDRQLAPSVLPRSAVTNSAMVNGNEQTISKIIIDGWRKQWVGIGWVDECEASDADKMTYPLVED